MPYALPYFLTSPHLTSPHLTSPHHPYACLNEINRRNRFNGRNRAVKQNNKNFNSDPKDLRTEFVCEQKFVNF